MLYFLRVTTDSWLSSQVLYRKQVIVFAVHIICSIVTTIFAWFVIFSAFLHVCLESQDPTINLNQLDDYDITK